VRKNGNEHVVPPRVCVAVRFGKVGERRCKKVQAAVELATGRDFGAVVGHCVDDATCGVHEFTLRSVAISSASQQMNRKNRVSIIRLVTPNESDAGLRTVNFKPRVGAFASHVAQVVVDLPVEYRRTTRAASRVFEQAQFWGKAWMPAFSNAHIFVASAFGCDVRSELGEKEGVGVHNATFPTGSDGTLS
jgi:hypothetical protein